MKLDPVLIDTRNYFGRPSYGFPWSRLGERPRIRVPYERFQNVPEDFWEPIVPTSSSRDNYQDHQQGNLGRYKERTIPITVERNPESSTKQQRKYEYDYDIDEEDEQLKLACRLSLANQNNNGTDVRRRRSHSGGRNQYKPVDSPESSMFQSRVHRNVIEIDDDDEVIDPPPPPPPRTTSLMSDSKRSSQIGAYRENTRGDNWNYSDESDSETVISLVPVKPKVSKYCAERNRNDQSKCFYIGSSDDSDVDDACRSDKNIRVDCYRGMEKQDEDFCKVMRIESGEGKVGNRNKQGAIIKEHDNNITPVPSYPAYHIIKDIISREGRQVDYIHGDGNCFFRSLSKIIYGSESCHEEIRQAVVDIMEKYPKEFEQFIDSGSIHEHIVNMRKLGTWGTQAEIYGAATLLQRDVYILSPDHTGENYRWLLFSPRFSHGEGQPYHNCYLTLCHTNGNHYDRIAPLHGECNCHLIKPHLSGVRAQIDLTDNEIV